MYELGAFWFDTRLLFPYNHLPQPGQDKILLTSQNTELLGNVDWYELEDDSMFGLQLTYITAIDPAVLWKPHTLSHKRLSRWLFYDAELERPEWDRRKRGSHWTLNTYSMMSLVSNVSRDLKGFLLYPFVPMRGPISCNSHHPLTGLAGMRLIVDWRLLIGMIG